MHIYGAVRNIFKELIVFTLSGSSCSCVNSTDQLQSVVSCSIAGSYMVYSLRNGKLIFKDAKFFVLNSHRKFLNRSLKNKVF